MSCPTLNVSFFKVTVQGSRKFKAFSKKKQRLASASEHVVRHQRRLDKQLPTPLIRKCAVCMTNENIETALWSTFFMAVGTKKKNSAPASVRAHTQGKINNRLHCVFEVLWNFDRLLKISAPHQQGASRVTAFLRDIRLAAAHAPRETERRCQCPQSRCTKFAWSQNQAGKDNIK